MAKQLRDFLVGLDNANEVESKLNEALKEAGCKIFIDDGKDNIYVPKSRLDSKILELKGSNDKIKELNTQISTLKDELKDTEGASEKIKVLENSLADYDKTVKEMQLNNAVKDMALQFKAKDNTGKDILAFLDKTKINIGSNGEITGIKEQVESLKKEKSYLFEIEEQQEKGGLNFFGTGSPGKPSNINLFGSKTTNEGDFGKFLSQQGQSNSDEKIDSDYFFNKK